MKKKKESARAPVPVTDEQIRRLAEYLEGTCQSIDSAMDACGIKPDGDKDQYDIAIRVEQLGEIFLCDCCGWYCENSEMVESDHGQYCADCEGES